MKPKRLLLMAAGVLLVPSGAAAAVKLTLTPTEAPIRITETGDFTAVVTGNVTKRVRLQVCDGFGLNCVTGGSTTLGTITQIGTDANNNPIGRYTAPPTLPPTLSCQSVVLGCQVKIRGILTFTKRGRKKRRRSTATVVLAAPGVIRRASVANDGSQANDTSEEPSASADGRFVAFFSGASNLVTGDTNIVSDIFLRDTCGELTSCTPSTSRVSVASDGSEGNGHSASPVISADGRFVAFESQASNLVFDENGSDDIFIRDTCVGAALCIPSTIRVSVASDGTEGNGHSASPVISADGRFVAFESSANNLAGADNNGQTDIFVRDTCAGVPSGCTPTTIRVSVASDGSEANSGSFQPSISADGRFVAFITDGPLVAGDTNGSLDVFVRDTCAGAVGCTPSTTRVSVADDGSQANPSNGSRVPAISADGRFVTFVTDADNLLGVGGDTNGFVDVFRRDTCAGAVGCTPATIRISVANDGSESNGSTSFSFSSLSADGRFVAFQSAANNLVGGDTNVAEDIFLRDTCAGATSCTPSTTRLSVASDGSEADGDSFQASLSPDGRFVAFQTVATNLVSGDTNNADDIVVARTSFVRPPLAYVLDGVDPNGEVSVIDTQSKTVIQTIALGGEPFVIALTPDGLRAYITNEPGDNVLVLSTLSNTVIATIPVGDKPIGITVTPDGTEAYVCHFNTNDCRVIDTGANTVVATIPVGTGPGGAVFTADGSKAYITNETSNDVSIIDTATRSVVGTIPVGSAPHGLALSPDGSRLWVANSVSNNVSVINTSTNSVVATIAVGTTPQVPAFTPDGTRAYVTNYGSDTLSVINTATNSVIATISVGDKPFGPVFDPDGPTLYVSHDSTPGQVTVINPANNSIVATIPLSGPAAGIALRFVR